MRLAETRSTDPDDYQDLPQEIGAMSRGEPVSRVAGRHGYRGTSAFTAAFVRTMGQPPSRIAMTSGNQRDTQK